MACPIFRFNKAADRPCRSSRPAHRAGAARRTGAMIGYFAALMMLAEPAPVSVEQLDQNPSAGTLAPVEQVSRGDNSAFVDQKPTLGEKPENLPQLSTTDTEVTLGRVDGIDRCSAELLSAKDADYCRRRIETRSEEFATRPASTLTAEQRQIGRAHV